MSWMLSTWLAVALLALCSGHNTLHEGYDLSRSSYHLCTVSETKLVSSLVIHRTPYTERRPCGGWLPWMTCDVTLYRLTYQTEYKTVTQEVTRCCDGYVQVGSYCALPLNRSKEFTAKPGSCPMMEPLPHSYKGCEWDIDCPGWQKCCQTCSVSLCTNPARLSNYSENGGWSFNVTVTVKTDYQELISMDRGLLNHTRLLHAMVTGALKSPDDVSVHHISSWAVEPFRTASSLLIGSPSTLSLSNTTSKLHLLLKHVLEVSSVVVEDVDECAHTGLRNCSLQANCTNTVGSYRCACRQGYTDVNQNYTGSDCQAAPNGMVNVNHMFQRDNTTEIPPFSTSHQPWVSTEPTAASTSDMMPTSSNTPPMSPTFAPPSQMTHDPIGYSTVGTLNTIEVSAATAPQTMSTDRSSNWSETDATIFTTSTGQSVAWPETSSAVTATSSTPSVDYNPNSQPTSSPSGPGEHPTHQQTSALPYISVRSSVAVSPSVESSTCSPPNLTYLQSFNITGASFCVSWSSQFQRNLTFLVVLTQGSGVISYSETNQTIWEVTGLMPGVLYNLNVIPCACGVQGDSFHVTVKTAAQTLTATARLTNILFTPDLLNPASQAYQNLTQSIQEEIYQSLSPQLKAMLASGEVRIQITGLSQGSVVVDFTIIFTPSQTQDILNVSSALLSSLKNSSRYTVDTNNTRISDFDECATGEMDCSPWATCINTWGSFSCICQNGFRDNNPSRPGRACLVTTTMSPYETTTQLLTTTTILPVSPTPFPQIATSTTMIDATAATNSPGTTAVNVPTTGAVTLATTTLMTQTTTFSTAATTPAQSPPTTETVTTSAAPVATTSTTATTTTTTNTTPTSTTTTTLTTTTSQISTYQATPLADVVSHADSISVQCRVSSITVTVARDLMVMGHISDSALYLGLQDCGINGGNASHAQLTVAWDECNTQLLYNTSHYTAQVTLFNTMEPQPMPDGTMMEPKIHLQVPVLCTYRKNILISLGSMGPIGSQGYDMIKDAIMGSGTFYVTVQLLNGMSLLPQNYSLSSDEDVVVQVILNSSAELIKVVINKCWATPHSDPADTDSYVFLENSCPLPNTYTTVLENGNSSISRLSVRIFSFVDLDVIYLHCQVQICAEIGSVTCMPDCIDRTGRSSNAIDSVQASCGPFHRSADMTVKEGLDTLRLVGFCSLGIGLTIVFLGCFICLIYYQRNRIGHYNFSLKPKQENITYLVFNT